MDCEMLILDVTEKMDKTIENLEKRFTTVRAGRANPSSLDGIMVEYYGSMTPLKQKAIISSNLGYNPGNDGETIRIVIPELTEERRRELAKQVKSLAEEAKVSIRNIRHDALEDVKKAELPEDEEKGMEKDIQDMVNDYNKKIDNALKEKEQELLTV